MSLSQSISVGLSVSLCTHLVFFPICLSLFVSLCLFLSSSASYSLNQTPDKLQINRVSLKYISPDQTNSRPKQHTDHFHSSLIIEVLDCWKGFILEYDHPFFDRQCIVIRSTLFDTTREESTSKSCLLAVKHQYQVNTTNLSQHQDKHIIKQVNQINR